MSDIAPVTFIAGLVGIFGARWMKSDIAAAVQANKLSSEQAG